MRELVEWSEGYYGGKFADAYSSSRIDLTSPEDVKALVDKVKRQLETLSKIDLTPVAGYSSMPASTDTQGTVSFRLILEAVESAYSVLTAHGMTAKGGLTDDLQSIKDALDAQLLAMPGLLLKSLAPKGKA